jgi:hypothetical protein
MLIELAKQDVENPAEKLIMGMQDCLIEKISSGIPSPLGT